MLINVFSIPSFADESGIAIDETNFPDSNFRKIVATFDTNGDGRLSKEECDDVKTISCESKDIETLRGISNFYNLKELDCSNNKITSIDLSKATVLEQLICSNNEITKLDISTGKSIKKIDASNNKIKHLTLPESSELVSLNCSNNKLYSLDVSRNANLEELNCSNNHLSFINLESNKKLENININSNIRSVNLNDDNTFDLTTLSTEFDVAKVKKVAGGKRDGNILKVQSGRKQIKYQYDCGQEQIPWFKLVFKDKPSIDPIKVNLKICNNTVTKDLKQDDGKTYVIPEYANKRELLNKDVILNEDERILDILKEVLSDEGIDFKMKSGSTNFESIAGLSEKINIFSRTERSGSETYEDMSSWLITINDIPVNVALSNIGNIENNTDYTYKLKPDDKICIYYTVDGKKYLDEYKQSINIEEKYKTISTKVGESYRIPLSALNAEPESWIYAKTYDKWNFNIKDTNLLNAKIDGDNLLINAISAGDTIIDVVLPNGLKDSIAVNIAKVDKTELEKAIKAAEDAKKDIKASTDGKDVEPSDKWTTADEMKALDTAISEAKKVDEDANVKQDAVDKAKTDLENATKKFTDSLKAGTKEAKADKSELEKAIKAAETAKKNVKTSTDGKDVEPSEKWTTTDEMKALEAAISEAKKVDEDANAKQEAVDKAKTDLKDATKKFTDNLKAGTKTQSPNPGTDPQNPSEPGTPNPGTNPGDNPVYRDLKVVTEGQNDSSTVTKGNSIIYTIGDSTKAVFRIIGKDLKVKDLESVLLDGKLVDPSNYDVRPGSIIVTFKKSYLDSLKTGKHNITFNTTKGIAKAELVIKDKKKAYIPSDTNKKDKTNTGDSSGAVAYSLIAITALGAAYYVSKRRKIS